jgi:hypothetical protein
LRILIFARKLLRIEPPGEGHAGAVLKRFLKAIYSAALFIAACKKYQLRLNIIERKQNAQVEDQERREKAL